MMLNFDAKIINLWEKPLFILRKLYIKANILLKAINANKKRFYFRRLFSIYCNLWFGITQKDFGKCKNQLFKSFITNYPSTCWKIISAINSVEDKVPDPCLSCEFSILWEVFEFIKWACGEPCFSTSKDDSLD